MADVGFRDDAEPKLLIRTDRKLRWFYRALEAACDAVSWLGGLVAAGWVTGDLAGSGVTPAIAARAALAVCALAVATGLLAGMYRGRYQRGSFDELILARDRKANVSRSHSSPPTWNRQKDIGSTRNE